MSNLRLINETTGTNVSSVSLTDVFSADFDIYKIEQTDYTPLSATSQSVMRLINASGSVISSSNYEYGSLFQPSYSSFVFDNSTSSTFIMDGLGNDQNDTVGGGAIYYLFNPFSSTQYTFGIGQLSNFNTGSGMYARKDIGVLKSTASMTGIQFISTGSANITTNIRVFGLREDS